jgi:hypothetical protein
MRGLHGRLTESYDFARAWDGGKLSVEGHFLPVSTPATFKSMLPAKVLSNFAGQAEGCVDLGSPFTARLCRLLPGILDPATVTGRRLQDWPGDPAADVLALRMTGGLHALVLTEADAELTAAYPPNDVDDEALGEALAGAIRRNDAFLAAFLDSPPQTNETARAAMLLPGFLLIARDTGLPLALTEIGSSAGLNLFFDRFHYDYAGREWGPADSLTRLAPEVRSSPPPLGGELRIADRAGSDIAPIYISDPAQRLRLRSYIWADQAARLDRLDAAIGIASERPFTLEKADAAEFVRKRLRGRRQGEAFVLFHSTMWQYMPRSSKDGVLAALAEAGREATRDAPIARLRMEPLGQAPHQTLSLTMWPGGETRRLALCNHHGRWIEWLLAE